MPHFGTNVSFFRNVAEIFRERWGKIPKTGGGGNAHNADYANNSTSTTENKGG